MAALTLEAMLAVGKNEELMDSMLLLSYHNGDLSTGHINIDITHYSPTSIRLHVDVIVNSKLIINDNGINPQPKIHIYVNPAFAPGIFSTRHMLYFGDLAAIEEMYKSISKELDLSEYLWPAQASIIDGNVDIVLKH